jgi:hypothetical protein
MSSSTNLATGSETPPYPQSPDHHRRRRDRSPPPSQSPSRRGSPRINLHHRTMSSIGGEWTTRGRNNDWEQGSSLNEDSREKPMTTRKRWHALSPGPQKAKTFFTYFIFSLLIGCNIYIIARSFATDSTRLKDLLSVSERKCSMGGDAGRNGAFFDNDQYYRANPSPMSCDLCPPGDEFCESIG